MRYPHSVPIAKLAYNHCAEAHEHPHEIAIFETVYRETVVFDQRLAN